MAENACKHAGGHQRVLVGIGGCWWALESAGGHQRVLVGIGVLGIESVSESVAELVIPGFVH